VLRLDLCVAVDGWKIDVRLCNPIANASY